MSLKTLSACFALILASMLPALAADVETVALKTIDGKDTTLKAYDGKVLLIVNVASECGYTGQYAGLQQLQDKYGAKGFTVLGFPCNDFGGQEPGDESQIKTFCSTRYNVTFPMFAKVNLTGENKHPLFAALAQGQDIQWNFEKFLVGKDGKLIARYGSDAEPEGGEIEAAIQKALAGQ